jgi:hypothetical protein
MRTADRLVPTTWLALLFFVLLVAPGLLYDLLAERYRAKAGESVFREISRTVLASLIISTLSFSILLAIRLMRPAWMPDPDRLISGTSSGYYITRHYWLILRTLLLEGGIALAIAAGFQWIRAKRVRARLRPVSTWTKVFREECPPGFLPYVQVRHSNGMTYVGQVGHFTADLETADREMVLVPPLYVKKPDGQLKDMPSEWQRVVLSAASVDSLVVQYRPDPRLPSTKGLAECLRRLPGWVRARIIPDGRPIPVETSGQLDDQPAVPSANGVKLPAQAQPGPAGSPDP